MRPADDSPSMPVLSAKPRPFFKRQRANLSAGNFVRRAGPTSLVRNLFHFACVLCLFRNLHFPKLRESIQTAGTPQIPKEHFKPFIPTSIPCRVTLPTPTELPSFVQYNHINMQSTDIAQQATPMLAHTLARALPSELSSSMHSSILSKSTPHEPSYITQNDMEHEPFYTENDRKLSYWTC
jgi:hypothetical protein